MVYSISVDCPAIINLATGLKMQTQQSSQYAQLSIGDCCGQTGLTCDGNGRVTSIDWSSKNLNGFINATALNLLIGLQNFAIQWNPLAGPFPPSFPSSITSLNVGSTSIPGSLESLPLNLQTLHLDGANLSGDLIPFPDALTNLRIDPNPVTGSLFMNAPSEAMAGSTKISRVFIIDFSQFSLSAGFDSSGYCDFSNTLVYATQVAYLANACHMTGIIQNTECSVVLTIATELNIIAANAALFSVLQGGSCCTAFGVQCDSNSHVTGINWSGMGLNGRLNTANIELLYSYLRSFNVSNNKLTGSISNRFNSNVNILDLSNNLCAAESALVPKNPNALNGSINDIRLRNLKTLNLANNQFNGTFTAILPVVTYFNISNNHFNGTLSYMQSINILDASYNSISGNISLYSPSTVNIKHNMISNVTFGSSSNLVYCNLQQNNLISVNYPSICLLDVKTSSIFTTRLATSTTSNQFTSSSSLVTTRIATSLLTSSFLGNSELLASSSLVATSLISVHCLNKYINLSNVLLKCIQIVNIIGYSSFL